MRMLFSLVGLLVVCGIIAYMVGKTGGPAPTINAGKKAEDQVKQMTGNDPDIVSSILLQSAGDDLTAGMLVKSIVPTGKMSVYYGLLPGDRIVEIEDHGPAVSDQQIFQFATASNLIVVRPGVTRRLTLPRDRAVVSTTPVSH